MKTLQLGYPLRDMEAGSCGEARALIAESFGRPVPQCPLWSSIFGEVHLETAEATAGGFVATGAVSRRPGEIDRGETTLANALRALYAQLPTEEDAPHEEPRLYRLTSGTFSGTTDYGNDGKEKRAGKGKGSLVLLPPSEADRMNEEDARLYRDPDGKDSRSKRGMRSSLGGVVFEGGTAYVPRFVLAEEGGKGKAAAATPATPPPPVLTPEHTLAGAGA